MPLDREEYVEQAYFFRTLRERMELGMSTQELIGGIRHELLSTTKLPLALDVLAAELRLVGGFSSAAKKVEPGWVTLEKALAGKIALLAIPGSPPP